MSIYDQFITKDDIVFDIGANVGDKTAVFAELAQYVVAAEPQKTCCDFMLERFANVKNVCVLNKAIGKTPKYEMLKYSENTSTTASMSERFIHDIQASGRFENRWLGVEKVEVYTLRNLVTLFGRPGFIKIDVEGYESEVIQGLSQPVKALCFEFHPEVLYMAEEVFRHAATLGPFATNYAIGNAPEKLELTKWVSPSKMLEELKRFEGNNQDMGDIFIRWLNA